MRKGIGLCLMVLAFIWIAPAWGEEAPRIERLDADSGLDYASGAPWTCTLEASAAGTVTVTLADLSGSVTLLEEQVKAGECTLSWDGLAEGRRLTPGRWELTVRLTDGAGRTSVAEVVSIEVTAPSLAADVTYHTPNESSDVRCSHDLCFWTQNMGEMDEAAVWALLTQPVTVLEGSEREQVKVRREPSESCTDYVGEVTGMSQAVHVLQQQGDWTLVEAYSSSVEGSKVAVWALPFQGWVKTSLLRERQVDHRRSGGQAAAAAVYLQGRASFLHPAVLHRLSYEGCTLQRNSRGRISGGQLGGRLLVRKPVLRPGHTHQRRYPAPRGTLPDRNGRERQRGFTGLQPLRALSGGESQPWLHSHPAAENTGGGQRPLAVGQPEPGQQRPHQGDYLG